jgi:hypothetical protein
LALKITERLGRGGTVEGVEVELVFSHGDLESQMAAIDVTATWIGGKPRKPFTVDMRPLRRQPWTKAIRSALKNLGAA